MIFEYTESSFKLIKKSKALFRLSDEI